jgi:hypothetical protein
MLSAVMMKARTSARKSTARPKSAMMGILSRIDLRQTYACAYQAQRHGRAGATRNP